MLIISNTLAFNGGSTFILRLCKEYSARGRRIGVLVLIRNIEPILSNEIQKYADIYYLYDYLKFGFKWSEKGLLGIFFPLRRNAISELLARYNFRVHLMGIFGVIFIIRCIKNICVPVHISIGIYHQNEFMFSGAKFYFCEYVKGIFSLISPNSLIFLNEINRISYSKFFNRDFSSSIIVPVGIDAPDKVQKYGNFSSLRIVSIGNLVNFKTYNLHVINCMPGLLALNSQFKYDIYGEGPLERELKERANELGVSNAVRFHGRARYADFPSILSSSFLFVGSGTAVIEAAALGIPSLIGIESIKRPLTYGFVNQISGFSYNEYVEGQPLYCIAELIGYLSTDEMRWREIGRYCKEKAKEFSIVNTVNGFEQQLMIDSYLETGHVKNYSNIKSFFSFCWCAILHLMRIDKTFSQRRDQGTIS